MPRGLKLERHPQSPGGEDVRLETQALRSGGLLILRYALKSPPGAVVVPPKGQPERADELWRRTCFEAFIMREGAGYYELNLAPSGRWAAYRFDGYREGMADADPVLPPPISIRGDAGSYALRAEIDLSGLGDLPTGSWRVALTAVLEHPDGGRSYWALRHAPGKPDFHHPDSFVLELPPSA